MANVNGEVEVMETQVVDNACTDVVPCESASCPENEELSKGATAGIVVAGVGIAGLATWKAIDLVKAGIGKFKNWKAARDAQKAAAAAQAPAPQPTEQPTQK